LLHLRDVGNNEDMSPTGMGKGILDMRSILRAAESCGVKWLISEEANGSMPPMECNQK
jgi:hypothetical protein